MSARSFAGPRASFFAEFPPLREQILGTSVATSFRSNFGRRHLSHSVWLTRFAEAVRLPYEDIAELARRWKRNEPVTSVEVAAVLSPVLQELLEAQQRFTGEEIFE